MRIIVPPLEQIGAAQQPVAIVQGKSHHDNRGRILMPATNAPRRMAWVMAGIFFGYFFHVGVVTPYWPLWLSAKGASPQIIGSIIAATLVARTLGQPLFSYAADHVGRARVLLAATLAGSVALWLLTQMDSMAAITACAVVATFCLAPLVPVSDALTVAQPGVHYGRVRLWGSIGFILANLGAGALVARLGADIVVPLAALSLLLVLGFALLLPREDMQGAKAAPVLAPVARRALLAKALRQPALWWLMGATALINGSHGFYYAFVTKYWREHIGIDATWVGLLWAVGVVAEIIVLAGLGARSSARAGLGFLAAASLGALVRWFAMALSPALPMVFILQAFHALSFGCWQLGSVHLMRRIAPPPVVTSLMGIQSALSSGVVMASATWLGGILYARTPEAGFVMSGLMAGAGGLCLLGLAQTWRAAASQAIEPHLQTAGDDR